MDGLFCQRQKSKKKAFSTDSCGGLTVLLGILPQTPWVGEEGTRWLSMSCWRVLGLEAPWAVTEGRFTVEARRLDLTVDFTEGSRFP